MLDLQYDEILRRVLAECGVTSVDSLKVFQNVRDLAPTSARVAVVCEGIPRPTDLGPSYRRLEQGMGVLCMCPTKAQLKTMTGEIESALDYYNLHQHASPITALATTTFKSASSVAINADAVDLNTLAQVQTGDGISPWEATNSTVTYEGTILGKNRVISMIKTGGGDSPRLAYTFAEGKASGIVSFYFYVKGVNEATLYALGPSFVSNIVWGYIKGYETPPVFWWQGGDLANFTLNAWHKAEFAWKDYKIWMSLDGVEILTNANFLNENTLAMWWFYQLASDDKVYFADTKVAWGSELENVWASFTLPTAIEAGDTILSATLTLTNSYLLKYQNALAHVNGVEGTIGTFATLGELAAYSLTTAHLDDQVLALGANSFDVTAILQENVTAGQLATAGAKTAFKIAPETGTFSGRFTAITLTVEYAMANQPDYIRLENPSQVVKIADKAFGQVLNCTLIYHAEAK